MGKRFQIMDVAALISLAVFTSLFAVHCVDFSIAPFEDAAILMRYAEHFSQGHGIVWNIDDKPVDGATDFLFMVLLGTLVKAGMSLELAARFIGLSSHFLTVFIVYLTLRRLHKAHAIPSLVSAVYLAVGPGLYYVAAYFGTPFFALLGCISWCTALTIIMHGETRIRCAAFALSALITALIRPEGVILTGSMLLAIVYICGWNKSRDTIFFYIGTFSFLGGLYFLWRWQYFGFPFPNPFYKKGGGDMYPDSLRASMTNMVKLCLPFLPAYIIGFYSRRTMRLALGFSVPIIVFATSFILISNEMNFGARFQYALLPLVLTSWWPLFGAIREDFHPPAWSRINQRKRAALLLLIITVSGIAIGYQMRTGRAGYYRDGRYDVAVMLSEYKDKDYNLATTEAGLLPLYSRWRALDTWGLNDQWIAHNGGITEDYLDSFKPHVIIWHAHFSPLVSPENKGPWFEMVMTLRSYAESNGYVLAAVFGDSPYSTHYYYVRDDFKDSEEIVRRIRSMDYYWLGTGRESINYALLVAQQ